MTRPLPLGLQVRRHLNQPRSVIGAVARSSAGNVILRVGQENVAHLGWHQTEHVVLTVDEAKALMADLLRELAEINHEASAPVFRGAFEEACRIVRDHEAHRQRLALVPDPAA